MSERITLTDLLEDLENAGQGNELSIAEVLETIGERGYAPITLILSILAALPTGAVPGIPTVCGISIALISIQMVFGKRYPWLPDKLKRMSIQRQRYSRVADKIKPWTQRLDRLVKPRLETLVGPVAIRLIGLFFVALAACMPPLEILPFAAAAPAGAIAFISLGLAGRDGLWVILGFIPAGVGAWLIFTMLPG
ncbi:exopolysaccharide biosynthesis protein [Salinisphaera japonica]|uniref:Exopolysaccharide biosynthesis protein exod n=1 Tax=Salinisphaera japonica YTM-1 TaxID=1209778 RepID=A0A423PXD5_9GAMM|nr:exopolysaccharide biosynthesis protein [Salinisphaera japonica]ROO30122.1 hypothetical protein SAJA_05120 [Salinisphaera japonica YTM-1]